METNTTRTETHRLIRTLLAATSVCGGDVNYSLTVASVSNEAVRQYGSRFRIATMTDGSRWLVTRTAGYWRTVNSVAYLERLQATGRTFAA